MEHSILIVDDEMGICTSLTFALEDKYRVQSTQSPAHALRLVEDNRFDLCLLDLKIGQHDGLELLGEIKRIDPDIAVVIMTAFGSIKSSVEAIRQGAYTYLTKPLNIDELHFTLEQALEYRALNAKVAYLSDQLAEKYFYNGLIARSRPMHEVFQLVEKLKDVDTSVLISGESGTGKELVAKALHFSGARKKEHFEGVNCAAIPEGLLESELFGHKKGAFTGAVSHHSGKLSRVGKGTLFLDEIGDMPQALQAKLLRVLQEKTFVPLGSGDRRKLEARVISATNRNLQELVEEGTFRQDLYFRLNVVNIYLPPLRERKEDIPLLIERFIQDYNGSLRKSVKGVSKEAEQCLLTYRYPGNVRELINIIESAMVFCDGEIIQRENLPLSVREGGGLQCGTGSGLTVQELTGLPLKEVEKRIIRANLELHGGHRAKTAKTLQISEKGLRNKIAEYKL